MKGGATVLSVVYVDAGLLWRQSDTLIFRFEHVMTVSSVNLLSQGTGEVTQGFIFRFEHVMTVISVNLLSQGTGEITQGSTHNCTAQSQVVDRGCPFDGGCWVILQIARLDFIGL